MTPFSYDYKNRTLRGVIVNGVPYYDVTSVLECVVARLERGIRHRIDCEVKMEQELNDLKQQLEQLADARAALEAHTNDTI